MEVKKTLNTSSIKNFDELPLFLNAQLVSRAPSSTYKLLHEDGFPSLRIGSRLIVPKEQFRLWVERQTGGAHKNISAERTRPKNQNARRNIYAWLPSAAIPMRSIC